MSSPIRSIAGIARCETAASLGRVLELAEEIVHPNTEIVKTLVTRPGGIERHERRAFRLGDYFSKIELLPSEADVAPSLTLVFHIREAGATFWKDLIVSILNEIRERSPGVKTAIVPGSSRP